MCFLDKCLTFLKQNVKTGEMYVLERKAGSGKLTLTQTHEVGQQHEHIYALLLCIK